MDLTWDYVIKCAKALEVQAKRKYACPSEHGYWEYLDGWTECAGVRPANYFDIPGIADEDWEEMSVWLPRQDELQEMVSENIEELLKLIQWIQPHGEPYGWSNFDSMEQLWLQIVMFALYNKVWDTEKEDWVTA